MSDLEGTVFAGHRIEAVAGRGGMGVVYRATQLDLDRTVALKVIAADLLEDETARRRFVQEAQLAASIDHPHVIPIHSAGECEGVPYIAMRYVSDDARGLVRRDGALSPGRAARIVAQVAGALDAAHAIGLVHRDVKPANVLIAGEDHVYLTDFGLTRHVRSTTGVTGSGQWVGTLDYVAPEQIRGGQIDARTDVYALGCVLFYLLTGRVPYQREGDEARLWAHLTERPPSVRPGAPAAFDAVIGRALAKAPDDRYPSAGDLGRAALAAATGTKVRAPERAVASGEAAPTETPTATSERRRQRRFGGRALVALVGAMAVAVAVILLEGDEPPPSSPSRQQAATTPRPEPRVVARIPVGERPNALVRSGGHVWVGAYGSDTLNAIDPSTDRLIRGLQPSVGATGTADIAAGRGELWAATRARQIRRLDPVRGGEVAPPIELALDPVMIAARGNSVVVGVESDETGELTGQLMRFDATSGAVEASREVMHGMAGAVYARGWLWTVHGEPNFIVRRDPTTLKPRRRIPLPGSSIGGLAYGAGALWVTIPDQDQLVRYRLREKLRAAVEVGARPMGVGVRDGRVWVAASDSSRLEQIAADTLKPAGEPVPTPLNPLTIAVGQDGVWVTCTGENVVARVEVPD